MMNFLIDDLYINDFNIMGNTFYVKMQSTGEYRVSQDDIMDIQIPNSSGEMVPLSSLATLRYIVGPQRIQRFNKYTSAEMNAQAAQGVSSSVLMNVIENMKLPSKYHIEWTGMSYQERLNQGQIVFLMMMAMLFAYLFLVAQYESWTIPVPVMLSVGFAVLGALLGLTVLKESLSIYAQLGMVMLIGLAAKNAILMVEFSKQERESGLSVAEAAMNGANEEAVAGFLRDEIGICAIPDLIEAALDKTETVYQPQLSDILEADRLAREVVRKRLL